MADMTRQEAIELVPSAASRLEITAAEVLRDGWFRTGALGDLAAGRSTLPGIASGKIDKITIRKQAMSEQNMI